MNKSHLIKLNLGQEYIEIPISKLKSSQSKSQFSRTTTISDNEALLIFSTPQFSAQTESTVNVKLLKDFKGLPSLEEDIIKAGFKRDDILGPLEKTQKIKTQKMDVFTWTTPTFGSAIYFYLQNPHNDSISMKIGPFDSIIAKDFIFDWSNAKWKHH